MMDDFLFEIMGDPMSLQGRSPRDWQLDAVDLVLLTQDKAPVTLKTIGLCDCSECY